MIIDDIDCSNFPVDTVKWVIRLLDMFKEYNGEFPNKYPYFHWKSWLKTEKASTSMQEALIIASLIYEKYRCEMEALDIYTHNQQ